MNRSPDHDHHDRLLGDVLAEDMANDFRAALLNETLHLVRRRRRSRRARQLAVVIVAIGLLGFLARPARWHRAAGYEIVRTQPWSQTGIVRTQPLARAQLVASFSGVAVVHTNPSGGGVRFIGDTELLALAAPRGAVLIRIGPDEQTLLFARPVNETIPTGPGTM